jgi:hypothetical protein
LRQQSGNITGSGAPPIAPFRGANTDAHDDTTTLHSVCP